MAALELSRDRGKAKRSLGIPIKKNFFLDYTHLPKGHEKTSGYTRSRTYEVLWKKAKEELSRCLKRGDKLNSEANKMKSEIEKLKRELKKKKR
jgi:hypothetical protein